MSEQTLWARKNKSSAMPRQLLHIPLKLKQPKQPKQLKSYEVKEQVNIHVSGMRLFAQCRQKWEWASPLRRGLEPSRPYMPFFFGHVVHDAVDIFYHPTNHSDSISAELSDGTHTPDYKVSLLDAVDTSIAFHEARIKAQNPTMELWPHEWDPYQESIQQAREIMKNYEMWRQNDIYEDSPWHDSNIRWLATETKFQTHLKDAQGNVVRKINGYPVMIEGRFDGIVQRIDNGSIWVWENKTSAMPTQLLRSLDRDNQASMYTLAASRLLGRPVNGLIYNIINKKVPTQPKVLASGGLSKQKRIATSYETYMAAIVREHPTWTELQIMESYGEILGILLDTKGSTFVNRVFIGRSANELASFEAHALVMIEEMLRDDVAIYPAISPNNCLLCYFREACLTKLQRGNYEILLEAEFQKRVHWVSLTEATELSDDLDVDRALAWR